MTTHEYTTTLRWSGSTPDYRTYSRDHTVTGAGATLRVSADPAFRGSADAWNPELMLVAAASSCQLLSFLAVAARAGVEVLEYADDARGTMPPVRPVRITRVVLRPRIRVRGGGADEVVRLAHQAHEECYIASSLRADVVVEPSVEVA